MLVAACRDEFDVPLTGARENAIHALDYFVDNCIEDTGLPNGIYNVDTEQVVYWWTGILFPFQYSRDREMFWHSSMCERLLILWYTDRKK